MAHPGTDDPGPEPDSPADLQKKYRDRRRRWAWSVGRPYSQDQETPPPWAIDLDPLPDEG